MTGRDSVLVTQGLTRDHGAGRGIFDVTLRVGAGEVVGLVGMNGAGKTTLLSLVAGLLRPDAGGVVVDGRPLTPDEREARRRLAHVPDAPPLFEALNVDEHLAFTAQAFRVPDWRARRDALVQRFGLADRRRDVVATLSLGLRQRTALACALLHDPALLLLDEPLNGLDPLARRTLLDAVSEIRDGGAAVVISSHQVEVLERTCTRFVILHEGRVRHDGPLPAVHAEDESALESFLGGLAALDGLPALPAAAAPQRGRHGADSAVPTSSGESLPLQVP